MLRGATAREGIVHEGMLRGATAREGIVQVAILREVTVRGVTAQGVTVRGVILLQVEDVQEVNHAEVENVTGAVDFYGRGGVAVTEIVDSSTPVAKRLDTQLVKIFAIHPKLCRSPSMAH